MGTVTGAHCSDTGGFIGMEKQAAHGVIHRTAVGESVSVLVPVSGALVFDVQRGERVRQQLSSG